MKWTSETPTKPGWYLMWWAKSVCLANPGDIPIRIPFKLVEVEPDNKGKLCCLFGEPVTSKRFGCWAGPIPEPEE